MKYYEEMRYRGQDRGVVMDIEDQPIKAYVDTAGDLRDCLCLLDPPTQKYLAEHLLFRLEEQGYECDWDCLGWRLTAIKTEEL